VKEKSSKFCRLYFPSKNGRKSLGKTVEAILLIFHLQPTLLPLTYFLLPSPFSHESSSCTLVFALSLLISIINHHYCPLSYAVWTPWPSNLFPVSRQGNFIFCGNIFFSLGIFLKSKYQTRERTFSSSIFSFGVSLCLVFLDPNRTIVTQILIIHLALFTADYCWCQKMKPE